MTEDDLQEISRRYTLARMAGEVAVNAGGGWDDSKIRAVVASWQDVQSLFNEVKRLRNSNANTSTKNGTDALAVAFDALLQVVELTAGYKAAAVKAGFNEEAATAMALDAHRTLMSQIAKAQPQSLPNE